jgi:hypothetical protein
MPANTSPIFVLTPNVGMARLAAANTARDGSGSISTVFTAGSNGSRVDSITFNSAQASAAASSTMVGRVFITDNAGANPRLLQEVVIAPVTASNTVIGATQTITFTNGLVIPSGTLLKVAISVYAGVQDQMDVIARGGDY